jgi:hypothetical protein
MNMKDYEDKAAELTAQAQKLEATMLTYRAFSECEQRTGHDFGYWIDEDTKTIHGMCNNCGVFIKAENYHMWFTEDNEEGFGDLAGVSAEDIELEEPEPLPQEMSETDDKPTTKLESEANSRGAYRVDVSGLLGRNE